MSGSDYKIFLSVKMFTVLLPDHCLQFTTCVASAARKHLLLTTITTDKPSCKVNKKIKHASLSVVSS